MSQEQAVRCFTSSSFIIPHAAWASGALALLSNRASAELRLRCRETGFPERRKNPNSSPELQVSGLRDQVVVQEPRHIGAFRTAGRTRTANQIIMAAITFLAVNPFPIIRDEVQTA